MSALPEIIVVEEDAVCFTQDQPCPRRWQALATTEQQNVRVCHTCGRAVYFCRSKAEAIQHCQNQEAVAAPLFSVVPTTKPCAA